MGVGVFRVGGAVMRKCQRLTNHHVAAFLRETGGDVGSLTWQRRWGGKHGSAALRYLDNIGVTKWRNLPKRGGRRRVLAMSLAAALECITAHPHVLQSTTTGTERNARDSLPYWALFCAIIERAKRDAERGLHDRDLEDDFSTSPQEARQWLRDVALPVAGRVLDGGDDVIGAWLQ